MGGLSPYLFSAYSIRKKRESRGNPSLRLRRDKERKRQIQENIKVKKLLSADHIQMNNLLSHLSHFSQENQKRIVKTLLSLSSPRDLLDWLAQTSVLNKLPGNYLLRYFQRNFDKKNLGLLLGHKDHKAVKEYLADRQHRSKEQQGYVSLSIDQHGLSTEED
jgi:hypothetical protein